MNTPLPEPESHPISTPNYSAEPADSVLSSDVYTEDSLYKNENGEADKAALTMIKKNPFLWHMATVSDITENSDGSITVSCSAIDSDESFSRTTDKTKLSEKIDTGDEVIIRTEEEDPQKINWIFSEGDEWGIPYGKQIFSVLRRTLASEHIEQTKREIANQVHKTTKKSFWPWKRS